MGGSVVSGYSKEEVNQLLEQKLNVNGTAVSAYLLTPGSTFNLTGGVSGSGVIDGSNVSINTTVDLSTVLKTNDSRIASWDTSVTNSHIHNNKVILDATTASYTTEDKVKLESTVSNNHSHTNKSILDATTASFTTADKTKIDSNSVTSHTHTNKNILDSTTASFTSEDKVKVDSAAVNNHTHVNKAVLDATTASFTTTLNTKLTGIATGANNYVHPASGVTIGNYSKVTVDANGHVTSGTNPTTLAGYGITDSYNKTEIDTLVGDVSLRLSEILGE